MKTNQLARYAAVILVLAGVAALAASAVVALRSFQFHGPAQRFDCGSVVFAKDPRNLAPRTRTLPKRFSIANNHCERIRNDRTHKALTFMLAGAAPLLLVLALPFISRRSRRSRARRRSRM